MSGAVQQDRPPQVAQAKAAHQRADLQVRQLPEEVRQQTAQTLEEEQLRAAQRRRAVLTYRFERHANIEFGKQFPRLN